MRLLMMVAVSATALLAACSNTRRCDSTLPYQKAETLPTPGPVQGLTVPDSPSALRIPPPPANSVAFGQKVADPKNRSDDAKYECLDTPPKLAGAGQLPAGGKLPPDLQEPKKKHWWWPW